jgi:hypothetical protein
MTDRARLEKALADAEAELEAARKRSDVNAAAKRLQKGQGRVERARGGAG